MARKREGALEQDGAESVARQHAKGRLTVRERVEALLDEGSFAELGVGAGVAEHDENGALTGFTPATCFGFGELDGRRCIVGGARRILCPARDDRPARYQGAALRLGRTHPPAPARLGR